MTKEEFLKELYCDPADRSYANRYIQTSIIMENSSENRKRMEDFLYQASVLKTGIDAFFGYIEEINENICIFNFSIGKGCIVDGERISRVIPDSVVITVNSWDDYDFAVYSNGIETEDYTMNLTIDGPFNSNGHRVDEYDTPEKECNYEIDAEILIDFQGIRVSVDGGGGGLCPREACEYYSRKQKGHSDYEEREEP